MRVMGALLGMAVMLAAGCAGKAPPAAPATIAPAPRVDVGALIRRGCFRCLEQARAAVDDPESSFEIDALLVLRAKELGLPYRDRLADLRARQPSGPGWDLITRVIDAIPPDPQFERRLFAPEPPGARQQLFQAIEEWRAAADAATGSPLFRAYLSIAIACNVRGGSPSDDPKTLLAEWPDVPLIRYRTAICTSDSVTLAALRAADADFLDLEYFIGVFERQGSVADLDSALRHMEAARAAFPDSLSIPTVLGTIRQDREEWEAALEPFDAVLARQPDHRDALLGRTISLSHLKRHDEAIASATRMIDLGEWLLGPAHYWRAWNELQLRQLDAAAVDRDRTKSLMSNAQVFVLSGLIDWGQKKLPSAETEFTTALTLDFGQCEASLYLGAVRTEQRQFPGAIAAFQQAVRCYDLAIGLRRKLVDEVRSGPGSDAGKARVIAAHERAIADAMAMRDQAARDAATVEKAMAQTAG